MTSLIFGVVCIYFAVSILRMPEEKFRQELDQVTGGRSHSARYYRMMRNLVWGIGFLGAAMILLRFF